MNAFITIAKKVAVWKSGLVLTGIEVAMLANLFLNTLPNDGRLLAASVTSGGNTLQLLGQFGKGILIVIAILWALQIAKRYIRKLN